MEKILFLLMTALLEEILQKKLIGRLSAAGQIDPSFKQRAITYRKSF